MSLANVPADASAVALYSLREGVDDVTTYGVIPGAGTPATVNYISEDLTGDRGTLRAALAKSSRLPGPLRQVAKSGSNKALSVHLAPGADLEAFFEMGLAAEFVSKTITAITIDAAAGDNSFNDSGNGFTFVAGQYVKVSGFTDSSLNGRFRIDTATAGKIVVSGGTLVTEAAGNSITIAGDYLTNGTKVISAVFERHYTDLSANHYQAITGNVINSLAVGFDVQQLFTVAMQLHNRGPSAHTSATALPAAAAARVNISDEIADASNHMVNFRIDGTLFAAVQAMGLTLNNNFTPVNVSGDTQPCWQSLGTAALTGNFRGLLLDTGTLHTTIQAFTPVRLSYEVIPDASSYTHDYVMEIHRAKFTRFGDFTRQGETGPVVIDAPWEADEDTTLTDRWITISKVLK